MRKLTYILAILVIAMGVGAGMFFSQCERLSDVLQQSYGYSGGKANAVKHAYAAAKIYDGLRGLGFAPDRVESVIGFSGVARNAW
jgi:hypothetical protein